GTRPGTPLPSGAHRRIRRSVNRSSGPARAAGPVEAPLPLSLVYLPWANFPPALPLSLQLPPRFQIPLSPSSPRHTQAAGSPASRDVSQPYLLWLSLTPASVLG